MAQAQSLFSAPGLCAATAPLFSLFTRYSGSSGDGLATWPLILVFDVSFFTTSPLVRPCEAFQLTLSPGSSFEAIAAPPLGVTFSRDPTPAITTGADRLALDQAS